MMIIAYNNNSNNRVWMGNIKPIYALKMSNDVPLFISHIHVEKK